METISYEEAERRIEEIKKEIIHGMKVAFANKGYHLWERKDFQFYVPKGFVGAGYVVGTFCIYTEDGTPYNVDCMKVDKLLECYRAIMHLIPNAGDGQVPKTANIIQF